MSENLNEENNGLGTTEVIEQPSEQAGEQAQTAPTEQPETDPVTDPVNEPEDADTFPREYVEKLRKEAAGHRDRAKRADDFAHRLHTALVEATGRLADSRDLPYDESHLEDSQALSAAIDALLADKPHLATRKPAGNIGQGLMSEGAATVSLGGLLRANAG